MSTASDNLIAGLADLCEALRVAAINPADQVRLLISLADFYPVPTTSTAPIGQTIAAVEIATAAACRRCALVSLARACAAYQPTSFDDAVALRSKVAALLDAEILVAADAEDDNVYMALRELRTAVVTDLTARGADLPNLITVTTKAPVSSLTLAYRLYGDSTRADDITARADPINPAFLPLTMSLLAS